MKYVFKDYAIPYIIVIACIFIGVFASIQGTLFTKTLIDEYIKPFLLTDNPNFEPLARAIGRVAIFYAIGIISGYTQNRIMINITQGTLRNLRDELFEHMQKLPIKYFDTNKHGDIMSHYTNDIDTLRQLISQSLPSLLQSAVIVTSVLFIMLYYSVFMTLVIIAGIFLNAH